MAGEREGHGRYEELAVGHVLGGLASEEAASFRAHLLECRDCRMRVAELRNIAASLAETEREERRRAAIKTEVVRANGGQSAEGSRWSRLGPHLLRWGGVLAAVLAGVLLVWNYHLRENNRELLRVTDNREQVLTTLARGQLVRTDLADGVTGLVAVSPGGAAVDLAGIGGMAGDERVVVWLLDEGGAVWKRAFTETQLADGRLALFHPTEGARWLLVSVEGIPVGDRPSGRVLVRADLHAGQTSPGAEATDQPTAVPAPG